MGRATPAEMRVLRSDDGCATPDRRWRAFRPAAQFPPLGARRTVPVQQRRVWVAGTSGGDAFRHVLFGLHANKSLRAARDVAHPVLARWNGPDLPCDCLHL